MQVAKWGSSLAVRLPVALHAELLPVSGTRLSSLDLAMAILNLCLQVSLV